MDVDKTRGREEERRAEGLGSSGVDATQSWELRGPRLRAEPPVGATQNQSYETVIQGKFVLVPLGLGMASMLFVVQILAIDEILLLQSA